jgi:hypothetical protein
MGLIGCEICLKLQKLYAAALRHYVDSLQHHTNLVTQGDFVHAVESRKVIEQISLLCAEQRSALQRHHVEVHLTAIKGTYQ